VTGVSPTHSPELIKNISEIDSKVDIFALGAIVYQIATGYTPFSAKDKVKRSR
jgi:serine/threonine protein kinase